MTTNGFDIARFTEVTDVQAVIDDPEKPCAFAYVNGWQGYADDYKFNLHRKIMSNARSKLYGGFLWGCYMEVGYGETSKPGAGQAANFWSLITAGGIEWNLPPWVALEDFSSDPRLPFRPYLDNKVMPTIHYLADKMGELPMVYTGPNYLKNYLHPALGISAYDDLWKCPLTCARYMNFPEPVGCANPLVAPGYDLRDMYPTWAMWQYYGDWHGSVGVSDLDWVLWPGDRASLEAWAKDRTKGIPPWTQPETETWATVTAYGESLRLRDVPGLSGGIMGHVKKNTTFKVTAVKEMDGLTWVREPGGWVATTDINGNQTVVLDERTV